MEQNNFLNRIFLKRKWTGQVEWQHCLGLENGLRDVEARTPSPLFPIPLSVF
jgi:hypothetical protein